MRVIFLNTVLLKILMINPWHDVSLGENAPEIVNAIIEIPKNSHVKYELDKNTGLLRLDRFLYSAVYYPGDYGFVPQTLWEDGDPLDIIILTGTPVYPMTLVKARVIGVLRMIDNGEKDDKIIAVYEDDPRTEGIRDIDDIHKYVKAELKHFFERYKELEGKEVNVLKFLNKKQALKDVEYARKLYLEKFSEGNKD